MITSVPAAVSGGGTNEGAAARTTAGAGEAGGIGVGAARPGGAGAEAGTAAGALGPPPVVVQLSGVEGEEIVFGFVDTNQPPPPPLPRDHDLEEGEAAGNRPHTSTLAVSYVTCVFGAEGTLTMTPQGCIDGPY